MLEGGIVHYEGHTTTYQSQVPVTCLDGFDLVGKNVITCLATGQWDKTSSCKPKGTHCFIHVDFDVVFFSLNSTIILRK